MEIFSESSDGSAANDKRMRQKQVKRPKSSANRASSREILLNQIIQRRCRCVHGLCFTQFKNMEKALQARRDEFRAMDDCDKDPWG